jgi:hypothetical protein
MIIELIIHIYQILKENNKIQKNQIKNHNKKYTNNNNNIMDFNHGKMIQILMIFNNDFFFISYINLFIFI